VNFPQPRSFILIRSLFLHYGPGGNSYAEQKLLSEILPNTLFWDQPKVKTSPVPFKELVLQSEIKAQAIDANELIAHSFGCDVAANLLINLTKQIQGAIFISPLRNIPQAMVTLAKNEIDLKSESELSKALATALKEKERIGPSTFWGLVTQIVSHPEYKNIFWANKSIQAEHERLSKSAPEFDAPEWQTLIQHYLFAQPEKLFSKLKNKNVRIIFGKQDPYIDFEIDIPYWEDLVGKRNVLVIQDAGHSPHLEQPLQFQNFVRAKIL
jgi:pimeloyl-ACP methyl ester carboxylesterase